MKHKYRIRKMCDDEPEDYEIRGQEIFDTVQDRPTGVLDTHGNELVEIANDIGFALIRLSKK